MSSALPLKDNCTKKQLSLIPEWTSMAQGKHRWANYALGSCTAKLYVPLIEVYRLVDATDGCCRVRRVADWSEAHF